MSQITVQLSARCAWWLAPMLKTYAVLCWLFLLPPSAALIEWLVRRAIKVKAELWHETNESWRFRVYIEDYQRWLGAFPGVAQVLKSLRATVLGSEPINAGTPVGDEVCTVGGLRTQLLKMQQIHSAVHAGERIIPAAGNRELLGAAAAHVASYPEMAKAVASLHPAAEDGDSMWKAEVLEQLKIISQAVGSAGENGNAMRVTNTR